MMKWLNMGGSMSLPLLLALCCLCLLTAGAVFSSFGILNAVHSSRRFMQADNRHSADRIKRNFSSKFGGRYLEQCWHWHYQRWLQCGFGKAQAEDRTFKWLFLMTLVGISVFVFSWRSPFNGVAALGLLELLFFILTGIQAKARQAEFATGVYRVYRYMALQMTAGMSPAETLRHLHEAVAEPYLKEAVYSFSSCYFRTMDLEQATEELVKRIAGDEIQVLATVLRQGVETGDAYSLIQKQEQLMLKRYYAALETETAMMQAKGIGLATGLCLLVFILLALPLLYEMGRASQMIFN